MYLSFSPLFSGSSREIDTIVFAEVIWIFHILKFCTFSLNQSKEGAFHVTLAELKPF